ncbi:MAG: tetratricopeptide repeat protein [Ramlibacter sp.]|jgi:tetratricopeptide (TPR) repeat protein|nr:tetratricopeptide repeat protein [Ramlibacter sp.]
MSFVVASPEAQIDQALSVGALQEALQIALGAEQQQPANAALQHRLGVILLRLNRAHEAFAKFSNAIRLNPLSVDTRVALAQAYLALNDGWSATAWLSDACRVAPQNTHLWLQLAQVLTAQKRDAEVEPTLRSGVAVNPQSKPLLEALAELILNRKRYSDGVKLYADLHAMDDKDSKTLLHYGFCLEHVHRLEESVARYREALAVRPDFLEAHVDLAGVLWRLGDYDGSLAHAQRAVEISPDHPFAVRILGTALLHLNRLDEAEAQLRRALAIKPDFPIAIVDLALLLLLAGRFDEGWQVYERRWTDTDRMNRPAFFRPELEWQGPQKQPVAGKRIVIYAEQGLGDVINFIRYAKVLQADGATVYCVIQPELVPLVESMEGVIGLKPNLNIQADYHVALLELPLHYRTNESNLPNEVPYLHAPVDKVAQWRDKLKKWDGKLKVGITWAGHYVHANHHNRCMPLSEFKPIIEMAGVQCFSLQRSDGERYTDLAFDESDLVDFTADWTDFTDSAAMIANLDLVISIDSAVVHLAGALGKPVWMVLPPNPDWRWLLERDNSPWYPTMRLFRREHKEARSAQMARVVKELKAVKKNLLAARQPALV